MKNAFKICLKIGAFAGIVLLFCVLGGKLVAPNTDSHGYDGIKDKKEIDALFIGSSHAFCSTIPQKIYDDIGVTSVFDGASAATIDTIYVQLEETLTECQPKVIFWEASVVGWDNLLVDNTLAYTNGIRNVSETSIYKWKAIMNSPGLEKEFVNWTDYFNITSGKDTWWSLGRWHFERAMNEDPNGKSLGYQAYYEVEPLAEFSGYSVTDTDREQYKIEDFCLEYTSKIIDLCKKNGIQLVMYLAPYEYDINAATRYDQMKDIAETNGCIWWDLSTTEARQSMMIDSQNDFCNSGHLNYYGAMKFTSYFENLIVQEQLNLKDHRNEKGYEDWKEGAYSYLTNTIARELPGCTDVAQYVEYISQLDSNYIIEVSGIGMSDEMIDILKKIGFSENEWGKYIDENPMNFVGYICGEKQENMEADVAEISTSIDGNAIQILADINGESRKVNGDVRNTSGEGIAITIYSRVNMGVVDAVKIGKQEGTYILSR